MTGSLCETCRHQHQTAEQDPCDVCTPTNDRWVQATPSPIRAQILQEALHLTTADRNDQYGDPLLNMACAGELKAVLRKYNALSGRRVIGPGEWEGVDMACTKLSRIATGGDVKKDNYVDGAAYLGAAGENAQREANGELKDA